MIGLPFNSPFLYNTSSSTEAFNINIVLTNHVFSIVSEHETEVKTTSTSSFIIFDKEMYSICTCLGSQLLCLWSDDMWNLKINTCFIYNFFFPSPTPAPNLLLIQAPDRHGITPLISACYENHIACVKLLLEKVGDLNPHNQLVCMCTNMPRCPSPLNVCWCVRGFVWVMSADEVTHWTKGPLTYRRGGGAGMSIEYDTVLLFTSCCFFCLFVLAVSSKGAQTFAPFRIMA